MLSYAIRAAVMYFMALIMVRVLGKRALGELGPFDFVVMTGVGHTVVSIALDQSIPFIEGVGVLATLAFLEWLMCYLGLKSQRFSNLITGSPVVLIDNGRIIKENLAKEKFNVDDLMQELRKQGIPDVDMVEKGVLESSGGFSVILRGGDEPLTRRDLGINPPPRNEISTTVGLSRSEFFRQQKKPTWQGEPEFSLPQAFCRLEAQLQDLSGRLEEISRALKA
ncbi:MAG: DUF421 domain-containing protein [Syntrophomonadaceae bacterium]|jgi:uncharacterized membrane protein YcaP (DUF421 family)|nr:DUF421 domain-containing protein [Syntrophomonadaceae bacterium]